MNFENYQSPFSWRYGSPEMRALFSEINKRKTWRKVWVALAIAQNKLGLITKNELEAIVKNQENIDIEKAHEIEKEIKHDLMAELKTFAAQSGKAGGKIHLGATSQDIEDNADIINFLKALNLVETKLKQLLLVFAQKIEKNKDLVCMGYTHLQPAEPTTLGYRFAAYAQDLLLDFRFLSYVKTQIKGKGIKGAVGTSASYHSLLKEKAHNLEDLALSYLKINSFDITTQVYPRKIDYLILTVLSSIAQSLYKFAFDLRILQSPGFGELQEPFGAKQVGSSAMPFKRNPINAEKICSLSRIICAHNKVAWENAANSLLERTLDDSASRRIILPESFLAADEIISQAKFIVENLAVNQKNIQNNLEKYGPFSGCENLMMQAVKNGADRQIIHEAIRKASLAAWDKIALEQANPLVKLLKNDKIITKFVKSDQIAQLINPAKYIGLAPKRCALFVEKLRLSVKEYKTIS
ncbi:MAG: adenylosuccinate lyase [Candidatus Spechtbacteria bacterium RIFCSPLOWO2_01_FULL_43_12]|uniref:Adenylosuccinate lyase n=1 Tax=Candidatus Spechtbacteria bacterium RIFCSPLOWO2_01_FULL_43_12 TaxID=1802162 RepID=A0A1G2HEL8_9BACT|nr:MAG: adenylosuccinate lyase [Candidatus Spechtbacteria bacterium RIFCSPLOWO2_01_FULL_43_12]